MADPLSEAVCQILLAMADRPRHGLGVADEVERRTGGSVVIGAGTLYSAIGRMREDGWIEEVEPPPGEEDPRRRFYALTSRGRSVLRDEVARLDALVADARRKSVHPREASG